MGNWDDYKREERKRLKELGIIYNKETKAYEWAEQK